jgi:hypothetical protein
MQYRDRKLYSKFNKDLPKPKEEELEENGESNVAPKLVTMLR